MNDQKFNKGDKVIYGDNKVGIITGVFMGSAGYLKYSIGNLEFLAIELKIIV